MNIKHSRKEHSVFFSSIPALLIAGIRESNRKASSELLRNNSKDKLLNPIIAKFITPHQPQSSNIYEEITASFTTSEAAHILDEISNPLGSCDSMEKAIAKYKKLFEGREYKNSILQTAFSDLVKAFEMTDLQTKFDIWMVINEQMATQLNKIHGTSAHKETKLSFLDKNGISSPPSVSKPADPTNLSDLTGWVDSVHAKGDIKSAMRQSSNGSGDFENLAELAIYHRHNGHIELCLETAKHVFHAIRRTLMVRYSEHKVSKITNFYVAWLYTLICEYGLCDEYPVDEILSYLSSQPISDKERIVFDADFVFLNIYTRNISIETYQEIQASHNKHYEVLDHELKPYLAKWYLALADQMLQLGERVLADNFISMINQPKGELSDEDKKFLTLQKYYFYFCYGDCLNKVPTQCENTLDALILADVYLKLLSPQKAQVVLDSVRSGPKLNLIELYTLEELEITLKSYNGRYMEAFTYASKCGEIAQTKFQKLKFAILGIRALAVSNDELLMARARSLIMETCKITNLKKFKMMSFELLLLDIRLLLLAKEYNTANTRFEEILPVLYLANNQLLAEYFVLKAELESNSNFKLSDSLTISANKCIQSALYSDPNFHPPTINSAKSSPSTFIHKEFMTNNEIDERKVIEIYMENCQTVSITPEFIQPNEPSKKLQALDLQMPILSPISKAFSNLQGSHDEFYQNVPELDVQSKRARPSSTSNGSPHRVSKRRNHN